MAFFDIALHSRVTLAHIVNCLTNYMQQRPWKLVEHEVVKYLPNDVFKRIRQKHLPLARRNHSI